MMQSEGQKNTSHLHTFIFSSGSLHWEWLYL